MGWCVLEKVAKNRRLVSEVSDAYYILKKKPQINGAFFLPFLAKVALCFLSCKLSEDYFLEDNIVIQMI